MAVYVDLPRWKWRGKMWCHITADSLIELHQFAHRLGLRREWFQYPKTPWPHYDTVFHDKALELGAILVDTREIVRRAKALREQAELEEKFWQLPVTTKGRRGRGVS